MVNAIKLAQIVFFPYITWAEYVVQQGAVAVGTKSQDWKDLFSILIYLTFTYELVLTAAYGNHSLNNERVSSR